MGQTYPAGLVQMLLIRAGIETNPGPTPGIKYTCCVCFMNLSNNSKSVLCQKCKNWCHFRKDKATNCSQLKSINQYTLDYACSTCANQPKPLPNQPKPNQLKPNQPLPNKPLHNQPLPNQPIPNQPIPNQPIPNQPKPNQPAPNLPPTPKQPQPPHPTNPTDQPKPRKLNLKILQYNCNGIKNKQTELVNWMKENDVKIAALQETKLSDKSKISDFSDYTLVRKDRKKDTGGGLAFLVNKTII